MSEKRFLLIGVLAAILVVAMASVALWPTPVAAQDIHADAVVLVNSDSAHYPDFEHYIQPYLDNFGIPYTIHDIAVDPVTEEVVDRALIIVGHDGLDEAGTYLDDTEEGYISAAVFAGAGLVNFDSLLADAGYNPLYQYVQDVFDLTYGPDVAASSVEIGEGGGGIRINCWEDDHQDPVLPTTSDVGDLDETDGEWTEFHYASRPFPSVMAGADEQELHSLPEMHFYASGIPNGEYQVWANLYTSSSGRDMRYYYGYTSGTPEAYYVDTVGGAGGSDEHEEYSLGTVTITDGTFDIYVQDADLTGSDDYPFFGWAWIRLVPEGAPPSALHYITERHEPDETIGLSSGMTVLGMTPPADAEVVTTAGGAPFIAVRDYGQGKAVQWGSYAFTQVSVKGYVYGLDDLVWRSLVWAARKPFVMQGTPPLLPFRIDDCSGPFWWAEDAADHGLIPWIGFFLNNMSEADAAEMKVLVDNGDATASIHAFAGSLWFYYNHGSGDWSDAQIAAHYAEGTQWHLDHEIPISKYVLGHYYELGTNAFQGLSDWGVEFVGTQMVPGTGYGAPWVMNGPYRLYEGGGSSSGYPMYYADFITVPGHPEFDGQFFNVVTEIRDNAGYEWYPSNDVAGSIERGVVQTRRAFDSMVLATLFTHEQHIQGITQSNWNAILEGVLDGVSSYDPIYVTMDEAAQYVRATYTSDIAHSEFDPHTGVLTTTLTGETDMPTQFYLFTDCGSEIYEQRIDVPVFSGSAQVISQLPGELHRIEVSPDLVTLGFNDQQQFEAQGYDINDVPVVCAEYTWDVVNGGGMIDQDGLFTAGTTPGTFVDTVTASDQGITGTATVVVAEVPVDHFAFDPVGDQVTDVPFTIIITALDDGGLPVTSYDGTAVLTDTTGTIVPTVTDAFVDGVWIGEVTVAQAAAGVVISAQDIATVGSSNPFTVTEPPPIPAYLVTSDSYTQTAGVPFTVTVSNIETTINLWEDDHQDPVLETFTDPGLFDDTDGEWDEFLWVGHRDYPGVFGGINEADFLETMHFYANVPNGNYRVIANLYRSRDWRYYWGYTPDDPRAHSFDVDFGPSGDFAEYDLGTITITNSRFDLYTNYAEDLGGTAFAYFGWAWVRLVPTFPETTINLWEDDHQDPVLTTFTDWHLLNDHDGQWDEFLYTPSRPYPSILAGHDEWESSGLQPMHFFTDGIPSGIYEVWANLYTARHTRYFYGFTEAEALAEARWVDVAADTIGEQHTEYSLGTIEITDGRFDLWASDGDILSGSPYFYGWAHVRLVANGMTMTSDSPTMLFDGDGDGTFSEPGDDIGVLVNGTFDISARDTTAGSGTVITTTDSAGFWGRATYTILPGDLLAVGVEPSGASLPPNGQQQFTATGLDQWDNPIAGLDFTWDVVNGGGTIDENGLFTAGFTPGVYADTVVATTDSISGTATVTVEFIPADHFEFEFIYEPQYADVPIEVIITAMDGYGDPVIGYNGLPSLSDTTGTIAPTTTGPFTDGVWQGYVTIGGVAADVVITADDGTATGASNPFDVLAMPEHIYSVTSDSYVQVAGSPFAVTVAPITHTINLWEDNHQRPVLETTTNAGDLDETDGEWTEFHYVSGGRPFPSVMAGADEEDYGLPTMHFYTVGIPNGTYEVIANLYTGGSGRDMRYYYGLTPEDPKALYVDTVGGSGGSDQHTEYSLGEVTITNGRFDLYVRDADLLGGTYPIFGWAHVRLEPIFPETRINLWEDVHQDPVLTTTTEVSDLIEDDGEWTEFLYTSSRPYPTILAGADEEDYGLPVMHFYGDAPNGTYELIANLYTSGSGRDMRYYYGFTPEDPKALYVDTVGGSGGTEEHTEYSLGTVTITDGHFDLYVQDADLLGGTYPFFGWAWVRLVPTEVTMSSSSPTMLFDGDGDGTFGEPGDAIHLMTGEPFTTHALDTTSGASVLITATDSLGGTGVASYTILDLDHITVTPPEATLDPGATQQFTAQAYDSLGDPIAGLDYTWSVVNGGGTIDENGLFTAGTVASEYPDTIVAEYAGVQGRASVTVNSGPPVELEWAPVYGPQYATVPFLADLYALDEYGNVAADYDGPVDVSDTTGTLVPSSVTLVDGQWSGELRVDAVADGVVVTAEDGTFTADTDPFDVLPAPEQSYVVSSDSYVQTAGAPFTVTVTTISSTINLWEDNHQRPVLETFTDSQLFDFTDGEWDEFHWVGRDYPAVFGGITETVSGLLEPMHFYAVVPNGTYRVIANLYRSNDYRYFYGFDPGSMRAHSVDVTSGPIGDFAEFDLGIVTISDYRFNLYTDYAEVIVDRGAFPAFGWAWVHLEPTFEETLINCWEDDHQEPVLVTTGSAGDLIEDDGEWTEFHYSSRDYPSVMAGADEVDYGLPVMRFYADGIPDGHYEIIANLYTGGSGRDMRYYYGFAPDDYLAHYVDTVGGTGGTNQHTEYSLGIAQVTGGTFEVYVRDADLLPGTSTYPFFGWAWIRLIPVGLTMSSSSPTMLFDGDSNGVFGELEDNAGILVEGTFDIAARETTAGSGIVITATDVAGNWGAATYTVEHASAASIAVTPDPETVIAGDSVNYQATAEDTYGNTWDITAETAFSIEPGAGGTWVDNVYTSEVAGDWTVTGEHDGLSDTATLHVEHAAAVSVEITPAEETVTAGDSVTYQATAEDAHGNTWDVTAETAFSIETGASGTWVDNVYISEAVGDWAVTGEHGGLSDTATLHVEHSTVVSVEITPAEETVTAGESVTYQATAEDAYGNTWDVTAETTFSIEAGASGSWVDNVYTSEVAGDWAVTGEHGGLSDTATLHVEHGVAASITVTPGPATVTAGESVAYQATAEDAHGNTWDVTTETVFSIEAGAGGTWVDNVYTSETVGDWTVTGEYDGLSDTAILHVEHGAAASIAVTPDPETVTAGDSVTYQATAEDAHGNTWDVTAETAFSIEAGAGGAWVDNLYTSEVAGDWTVTGEYDGLTNTATLHVEHAATTSITVTPDPATVTAGESVTYQATAEDAYGNTWDVTAEAVFSIEAGAGGAWVDNVYTSEVAGDWTVTGEYIGLTDTATLHVIEGEIVSIALTPVEETVTAGESVAYTTIASDAYDNTWDVTAQTAFSIEAGAGGAWLGSVYTSEAAGDWTVTGEYDGLTDTATLHVEHAGAASIAVTPDPETVTAGDSVTYQATAEDAHGNTWDVTAETAFSIEAGAGGAWVGSVYTSEAAGDWTVTGEYDGLTDTATLHVEHAAAVSVEIAPAEETVTAGNSMTYQATAEDTYGNTWDATAETIFSIEAGAGGAWVDNVYTSETVGDWIVTGEYDGLNDTATLHVEHAGAASIAVTPDPETVTAGDSVTYQATAEDAHGNTWDVTAHATFSIEAGAGGTWVGSVYTSETVGHWTVTGEYDGLSDTAILHVEHAEAISVEISPADETAMAGDSVTYQATAEDAYGNTWIVTAETVFSIEAGAGGSWVGSVYTSDAAGDWTVTGEHDGLFDTATLHIEHAAALSIQVTLDPETVTAGESVTYQATAEDAHGNTWNVTDETAFSIEAGARGTWVANVYTSEAAGDWTVTGEYDGFTDTAILHVEHAAAVSIEITPAEVTMTAGESVTYQATAEDAYGNTWDVTAEITFSIEAGAGGAWVGSVYTSEAAGDWMVTGEHDGLTDTATLHVEHDAAVSIALSPAEETVIAGETMTYTVTAKDIFANTWDVTAQTTFTTEIGAGGDWVGNVYTSEVVGDWTVTGQHDGLTNTATLHVAAPAPPGSTIYLPIVLNARGPDAPDLVVADVIVTSDSVQVVIENQGDAPVLSTTPFWVDLYVNPHPIPTQVNQIWNDLCSEGIVWGVAGAALPLEPGEAITLTIGDIYYWPEYSDFSGSFRADRPIYVQVDSANTDTTYGAVLESHEIGGGPYNNVNGPVFPTISAVGGGTARAEPSVTGERPPSSGLPSRP